MAVVKVVAGHIPHTSRCRVKGVDGGWGWEPMCSCEWNRGTWLQANKRIFPLNYKTERAAQQAWLEHFDDPLCPPPFKTYLVTGQSAHRALVALRGP